MQTIFRYITTKLCLSEKTYLLGMIFVRFSRFLRKFLFKPGSHENFKLVTFMGSILMKVNTNNYMGGSIFWTGFHQLNELLFLKYNLKENMVFIDVGANQGEFTLYGASLLRKGKVIAFEPVEKIRSQLMENIRLNNYQNVEVFTYGLSNENCTIPIYTSLEQNEYSGVNEGLSSLYKTQIRSHLEQLVEVKIFDIEFENRLNQIDLIKIDIEGAELYALKGMMRSIRKFKPLILIEINEETFNAAGYSTLDLIKFVNDNDYEFYKIRRGKLFKMNEAKMDLYGNYVLKYKAQ